MEDLHYASPPKKSSLTKIFLIVSGLVMLASFIIFRFCSENIELPHNYNFVIFYTASFMLYMLLTIIFIPLYLYNKNHKNLFVSIINGLLAILILCLSMTAIVVDCYIISAKIEQEKKYKDNDKVCSDINAAINRINSQLPTTIGDVKAEKLTFNNNVITYPFEVSDINTIDKENIKNNILIGLISDYENDSERRKFENDLIKLNVIRVYKYHSPKGEHVDIIITSEELEYLLDSDK